MGKREFWIWGLESCRTVYGRKPMPYATLPEFVHGCPAAGRSLSEGSLQYSVFGHDKAPARI